MSNEQYQSGGKAELTQDENLVGTAFATDSLMNQLNKIIAKVPNFVPPSVAEGEICPISGTCSEEQLNQYRSAAVFLKALAAEAQAWRTKLPENYRPAIMAVLHGGIQVQVHSLAQVSFAGIRIEGSMQGAPCSFLAHQSTVQMLCYAEEILAEEAPKKRTIGFIWPDNNIEV